MTRSTLAESFDDEAELVERLAVLLAAGVAPTAAWRVLAASGSSLAHAVSGDREATGSSIGERLATVATRSDAGMRCLAAVWAVAVEAGAPLATVLGHLADSLRDLAEGARERQTALAGPRATSRIILALPPLGIVLGMLIGLDSLTVLTGTPLGWACLVVGVVLVALARRWTSRMLRRAALGREAPGVALELVAIGLSSGMPPERACALAARALVTCGLEDETAAATAHLDFAVGAGVPAGPLLQAAARAERRRARSDAVRRAEEMATWLVLPLGLCVLPAFVVLGVIPAAVAIVSSTILA